MLEQGKEDKIVVKFYMCYALTELLENGISYTKGSVIKHDKEYLTLY
jgi:hypothetical protein